jgi:hypothetical protein
MLSFLKHLHRSTDNQIVHVITQDGISLEGVWTPGGDTVLAHTHGTASFWGNEAFEPQLQRWCKAKGWGFLSFNTRGAHLSGAEQELFSQCGRDFAAWTRWLQSRGVRRIILSGHSLGTEKIAHWVRTTKPCGVSHVLFLAPSDTVGNQDRYEQRIGHTFFSEARALVERGTPSALLSDRKAHAGVLAMSGAAYLDFYGTSSPLRIALPFRNYSIQPLPVPVLALVPRHDHYNITSVDGYKLTLESAGARVVVCDTDHDFNGFDVSTLLQFS